MKGKSRKVCVITGTRAEYGLLKPILERIRSSRSLRLSLIATGMHLAREFGNTVELILADGFPVDARVDMLLSGDTPQAMAKSLGVGIYGIAQALEEIKPEVVLVLGDRVEALAGASAGFLSGLAVAHVHGGDVARGLDEPMRHAITKLSHLHFAATSKSRERLIKMGERPEHVFQVGAPGLDVILKERLLSQREVRRRFGLKPHERPLLVVQHPLTTEPDRARDQMLITLGAIKSLGERTFLIYPNADAGGRAMIEAIREHEGLPFLTTFVNLPRREYLSLLKMARVLVGNSSSGIIEAPAFRIPAVNIGERQAGRERSTNIIDVPHREEEILRAIRKAARDRAFLKRVETCHNPYGDGRAGERIARILKRVSLDESLLAKSLTY